MGQKYLTCDFLVIGSGAAGLYFSIKAAPFGSVFIVTKDEPVESNTNYAQGGIAAVMSSDDSFELHIQDTLRAGAGLCKEEVVREIVQDAPNRIADLMALGMRFAEREVPGQPGRKELDLGREGGHSRRRVLHAQDITGREVERTLLQAATAHPNIHFFKHHYAVDLITSHKLGEKDQKRCYGAYVLEKATGEVHVFASRAVILATGGSGKVYLYTSNPDVATGDGVAMAYRAGLPIANMEFVQFHPTCLYHPKAKNFLISEAVRGEGAVLKTIHGEEFMSKYHPMGALAPRDIVARAIDAEMKRTGATHVLLDITHKPAPFIIQRFPNIYHTCLQYGIDMTKEPIPVVPAAHYQCGGVLTTIDGATEMEGLFALGEVACTGLHGANRLASNSILEALVCANRAAQRLKDLDLPVPRTDLPPWDKGNARPPEERVLIAHLWDIIRRIMWDYVGIVRSDKRLRRAWTRILSLEEEIQEYYWEYEPFSDLLELRNIATVAQLIIASARSRPESLGLHYNIDHPNPDPAWEKRDTILKRIPSTGLPALCEPSSFAASQKDQG